MPTHFHFWHNSDVVPLVWRVGIDSNESNTKEIAIANLHEEDALFQHWDRTKLTSYTTKNPYVITSNHRQLLLMFFSVAFPCSVLVVEDYDTWPPSTKLLFSSNCRSATLQIFMAHPGIMSRKNKCVKTIRIFTKQHGLIGDSVFSKKTTRKNKQ